MQGDQDQEFIQRVTESQGIIHKICRIYGNDEEHRKDLSQEILIQLWKSYRSFRGESKFSTWMYRVALNVAFQQIRKSKKDPNKIRLEPDLDFIEPVEDDGYDEKLNMLHLAISQLNEVEKAIIMLHLDDNDNEEIARIIGITQNHVRVKMNRIRTKLKHITNPDHGT